MATVTALQSFVGRISKDKVGPSRVVVSSLGTDTFPGKVIEAGRSVQVVRGQRFDAAHPVVKTFPAMFGVEELAHSTPVEQATAAPGERRNR